MNMHNSRIFGVHLLLISALWAVLTGTAVAGESPELMLAEVYQEGIEVDRYWVSEKLDGVRARWDGKQLISRGGKVFAAPAWFTQGFPEVALDGELWAGRGRFAETLSIVRKETPHDGWREIKFMLFDLPAQAGGFDGRLRALQALVENLQAPYLAVIEQFQVTDEQVLMRRLQEVTKQGGEGLMLHAKTALYRSGPSTDLLKLKTSREADAEVIGYRPGKGRLSGMVGSLQVRMENGVEFYLGSGLSDPERQNPPPLGSRIKFRYQGLTRNNIPRFAVFVRMRDAME